MMENILWDNASRTIGSYGYEADNASKSRLRAFNEGSFCRADSASLARIAAALERLCDIMDPTERLRKAEVKREEAKENAKEAKRDATEAKNWKRLEPFCKRRMVELAPYFEQLKPATANAVRCGVNNRVKWACRWPNQWNMARMKTALSGSPIRLLEHHTSNIGPYRRAEWQKAVRIVETSTAAESKEGE